MLPGGEQVVALVRGRQRVAAFEAAPERLGRGHVLEDFDPSDLVRTPQACGDCLLAARSVADGNIHPGPVIETLTPMGLTGVSVANNYQ
jgi:hypothetical protein